MSIVGQTVERKRKVQDESRNRVTVRGWNGRAFVCESADEYGAAFLLTEAELAADYGARVDPVGEGEEDAQRELTATAHAETLRQARKRARPGGCEATPDPDSPEGKFAALAAEDDDAG